MMTATIAGTIGKDAETHQTQNSGSVTGFSVAVDVRNGSEKSTEWFDVSLWGKRGEALAQYLTKGSKVTVSGGLGRREHDGKTYLKINANEVTLQGGNRDQQSTGGGSEQSVGGGFNQDLDDQIPF